MPNNSRTDFYHAARICQTRSIGVQALKKASAADPTARPTGRAAPKAGAAKPQVGIDVDAKQGRLHSLHPDLTWTDTHGARHLIPRGKLQGYVRKLFPDAADLLKRPNDVLAQALDKVLKVAKEGPCKQGACRGNIGSRRHRGAAA